MHLTSNYGAFAPCRVRSLAVSALLVLVCALSPNAVVADGDNPPRQPKIRAFSGGPYCGVYSLYAACAAVGKPIPFEALLQERYIGSENGSSLGELQQAAHDLGVSARAVHGLTISDLYAANQPIILHVRRPGKGTPFLHWVVFLGMEGDCARIVDPPLAVELFPVADILSTCDGVGLVVSADPARTGPLVFWAVWRDRALLFVLVCFLIAGCDWLVQRARARPAPMAPRWKHASFAMGFAGAVVLLLVGSSALACISHMLSPAGLLHNDCAVGQVAGHHFEPTLASLTVEETAALVEENDTVFIDARLPAAYDVGHIGKALCLPFVSAMPERSRILNGVKKTDRVIVYCQNAGCPWAGAVASDLVFRGYSNVALFPGGWEEWSQHVPSTETP